MDTINAPRPPDASARCTAEHVYSGDRERCPICATAHLTKATYTNADRDRWMRLALGHLAPAGTWPQDLFVRMWHAPSPAEAMRIAMHANKRFRMLWGAWDDIQPEPSATGPTTSTNGMTFTDRDRGIWRAAMVLANNLCVQHSDRLNADDEGDGGKEAAAHCANRIRGYVEMDQSIVDELGWSTPQDELPKGPTAAQRDLAKVLAYLDSIETLGCEFSKVRRCGACAMCTAHEALASATHGPAVERLQLRIRTLTDALGMMAYPGTRDDLKTEQGRKTFVYDVLNQAETPA